MNSQPNNDRDEDRELEKLLAHACDDMLDSVEAAQLAERLRESADTRRAYLEAMMMERLLQAEHEDSLLSVSQAKKLAAVAHGAHPPAARLAMVQMIWPTATRPLAVLAALAASLLLATWAVHGWMWLNHDRSVMHAQRPTLAEGQPVGRLVHTTAVEWDKDSNLSTNEVVGGQVLRILAGTAELELENGAKLSVTGPAELEVVSATLMRARSGIYRATSGAEDEEFVLETPNTQVVKYAADFSDDQGKHAGVGVEIADEGQTDVVVFDGEVALQFVDTTIVSDRQQVSREVSYQTPRAVRHLGMGQGLRVKSGGDVHRIVSLDEARFPLRQPSRPNEQGIIRSVSDDLRDPGGLFYYKIMHQEFGEDARAFVDRFHQWNGIDGQGLPESLRGADYVMTFNNDKWSADMNLHVELAGPAWLYVFTDDRTPTPMWLVERFEETGWKIGLDEGWFSPDGRRATLSRTGKLMPLAGVDSTSDGRPGADAMDSTHLTGQGPGESVDAVFSVWRLEVPSAGQVTLGPPGDPTERTSMYGIAAIAKRMETPPNPAEDSSAAIMFETTTGH